MLTLVPAERVERQSRDLREVSLRLGIGPSGPKSPLRTPFAPPTARSRERAVSAGGEEPIENGRRAMRMPDSLAVLMDFGIVQDVVRPLMSGKEAQIYLVVSEGQERVAKVYKEAQQRTFKHRAEYTEGRKTRNSRDQRAINKRSRHGRKQDEAAWRTAEVDMIYSLRDAGVRVPEPFHFVEGVLVMELIKDAEGNPAPRLGDVSLGPLEAVAVYDALILGDHLFGRF